MESITRHVGLQITLIVFLFSVLLSVFVTISAFALLLGVPVGITSSAVELKTSALTAVIKNYKLIIKKKRKTMIK